MPRKSRQTRKKSRRMTRASAGSPSGQPKYRLPTQVLIHGIAIPVVHSECPGDDDAMGMFVNFPSPTIYINPRLNKTAAMSTLFHECLEAIGVLYNLELTENQVCTLEVELPMLLKQNPGLRPICRKI